MMQGKSLGKLLLVLTVTAVFSACAGSAGVVVTRPSPPVIVRPAPPRAGWVWVDGDYYWRGNGYRYRPGYWVAPRPGRIWAPGHWQAVPRGWKWHPGRWR